MHVLQSWKDSLSLFKPKNFKLFALVTLKTIGETYLTLFKYFWWFIVLCILWEYMYAPLYSPVTSGVYEVYGLLQYILTFISCVIVRPSVMQKNYSYFKNYSLYFLGFIVGMIVLIGVFACFELPFRLLFFEDSHIVRMLHYGVGSVVAAVILLFSFFELDMPLSLSNWVRAFRYAIKMFWYNAPAIILLYAPLFFISIAMEFTIPEVIRFAYWLIIPIEASIIGNFYIKRLHEQPQLYFKQPKE